MRRLVYDVAVSIDGFIAGPDDDVSGYLADGEHADAYFARLQAYGAVVMGRRTYEFGYRYGLKPGDKPYPHLDHHIFSRSMPDLPDGCGVEVTRGGWVQRIDALKAEEGADIYLCGGGAFAGLLLAAGRIDRLVLKVNPVILGDGVRLFGDTASRAVLQPAAVTTNANGVRLLEYELAASGSAV